MIKSGKVDTAKLAQSVRKWSKDFGDTNEETLARVSAEACRGLANKVQPWGTGTKARRTLEKAVYYDAVKPCVSVMDPEVWAAIKAGTITSLPIKSGSATWQKFNPANILRSQADVDRFIERHRKSGKIRGRIPFASKGICWHADLTAVIRERVKRAGIAKGAFIMAGLDVTRKARKKGLGIGQRYGAWAVRAARDYGVKGTADLLRSYFNPKFVLRNYAGHTRSPRLLRERDARNAITGAFKRSIAYYRRALTKMDKKRH